MTGLLPTAKKSPLNPVEAGKLKNLQDEIDKNSGGSSSIGRRDVPSHTGGAAIPSVDNILKMFPRLGKGNTLSRGRIFHRLRRGRPGQGGRGYLSYWRRPGGRGVTY
ncbi:hypothetical protein AX15_000759 [Amanita polypyramis BW_CC]|nr:hypothetical protein AX15_000759 [Amanita polypyramis BW_CC]